MQTSKIHYVKDHKGHIYEIPEENLDAAIASDERNEYLPDYKPQALNNKTTNDSTVSSETSPPIQSSESPPQGSVLMKDKDGGIFEIPQENIKAAQKAGGIIVDKNGNPLPDSEPVKQEDLNYNDRALQFAQGVANIPAFGADLANKYIASPALNLVGGATELAAKGAGLISSGAEDTLNQAAKNVYKAREFYDESNVVGDVSKGFNEIAGKDITPTDTTGKILNSAGEFSFPLGNITKGAKTTGDVLKYIGKHLGIAVSGALALEGTKGQRFTEENTSGRIVEDFLTTLAGMALGDKGISLAKEKIIKNSEGIIENILNKIKSPEDIGTIKKGAAKILSLGANPNLELNAAAKIEGIELPFEVALGGKIHKFLANTGLKSLFVNKNYNNVIENADKDMINAVLRKLDNINPMQLDGELASIHAKDFVNSEKKALQEEAAKLYDYSNSFLKETDAAQPMNGFKAAEEILPKVSAASPSDQMQFVSKKISQIGKEWGWLPDLSKYEDSPELIKKISEVWGKGNGIKEISAEKIAIEIKALKQSMRNKGAIHGVETLLNKFIDALETDISTVKNKEFLETRKIANNFFKKEVGERMRTNIATSLLKGEIPKDAFIYMSSASNIRQLEKIMGNSEAAKEVMSGLKRAKLEQILVSNIMDASGTITYSRLSNLFNKSPEKQALLKQLLGNEYNGMKRLADISQEFVSAGKEFGNPSKTTLSARDVNGIKDLFTVLGNTAATLAGSSYVHGFGPGMAAEPIGINILSRIASDRKIINTALKYAEASQKNNIKDKQIIGNRLTNMVTSFLKHQWSDIQKYPQASHVLSKKFREDMVQQKEDNNDGKK